MPERAFPASSFSHRHQLARKQFSALAISTGFFAVEASAGTTFVKRVGVVGKLGGNGNHCDFFVAELREYSGPKETLRKFYDKSTKKLGFQENVDGEFGVDFFKKGRLFGNSAEHPYGRLQEWGALPDVPEEKFYVVAYQIGGYANNGCDLRCL